MGPSTTVGDYFHGMKYRGEGEDFREAINRQATALKDDDQHWHDFRNVIGDMRFMAGGRVQSAMGSTKNVCAHNCFVSGTIEDSFVSGDGNIMQRATEAAATMRMGGGIGYDFSTLRPKGEVIKKLQSHSSGPVSFMRVYNEICQCVASSGHRRGAQMGVMRVDHPDIEEFLHAKQPPQETRALWRMAEDETDPTKRAELFTALQSTLPLQGFNVSIAVTDEFMEAALNGRDFDLRWGGQVYKTVDAAALWEAVMRSTWDWAEPGVLFIDRINQENNLWYCEEIAATNPCGEQPLPPFGACLLGSFNLTKYVRPVADGKVLRDASEPRWEFDWQQLKLDIPVVVRAMDNVIDRARYPLPQQRAEAISKRRMGLGITGLANAAEALGMPYGSPEFVVWQDAVQQQIAVGSYLASCDLAEEKGPFPLFDAEKFLQSGFMQRMPKDVRDRVAEVGIRNSHLTSVAPTGTISLCADNCSSGIEPVFSYVTQRPVNTPHGQEIVEVEDYGVREFGVHGRLADDVSAEEHVAVLSAAQKWTDSSVSKTCNVDGSMPWDDFKNLYISAWQQGAKGCTTFNQDGKRLALLKAKPTQEKEPGGGEMCYIDFETGRRECG